MHTSATRFDVARRAKVSESTVTRSLNNSPLIPIVTRQRVVAIAEQLGYIPNKQASLFAQKKTCRLGFVVRAYKSFPPFSRSYFPTLLDGAVLGAEERNYGITIILDKTDDSPKDLTRIVKSREVDGLIVSVTPIADARLELLHKNGVPLVLVNNFNKGFLCIDANPLPGMEKALNYAHEMGHKTIGFITGDMAYLNARDRLNVFNQLIHKIGLTGIVEQGDFSRTSGYIRAGKLIQRSKSPTLIMTSSDRQAFGVYDYCRDHRILIPSDLSIVGFDDFDPARDVSPTLTTIHNPVSQAGHMAAHSLIDYLEGINKRPVSRLLDTDFIVRQSTGLCPQL